MFLRSVLVFVLTAAATTGCRTAAKPELIQPGAPGQSAKVIDSAQASALRAARFTPADVEFMQGMIGHHQQAVEMTDLLNTRTHSDQMKKLGERIQLSQTDEIRMMERWLQVRGQSLPDPHAMHMHDAKLMPGMLSAEEMERLSAARGVEFDALFLAGMIKHHGGALTMVDDLFSHAGAGQDSEIFSFASDVDADQRMEIARMGAMLEERMK